MAGPGPCRHCGSPYRGNPCWARIKFPGQFPPGGPDLPCETDGFNEDMDRLQRGDRRRIVAGAVAVLTLLALLAYASWS